LSRTWRRWTPPGGRPARLGGPRGGGLGGRAVKSALRELPVDLTTVRADMRSGGVPPGDGSRLHAAANTAGKSC
jgi:hypothetical protein